MVGECLNGDGHGGTQLAKSNSDQRAVGVLSRVLQICNWMVVGVTTTAKLAEKHFQTEEGLHSP